MASPDKPTSSLGHVVSIGGSRASVRLNSAASGDGEPLRITVGKFLAIAHGQVGAWSA